MSDSPRNESKRSLLRRIYEATKGERLVRRPTDRKRRQRRQRHQPTPARGSKRIQISDRDLALERAARKRGMPFPLVPQQVARARRLARRAKGIGRPGKVFR